MFPHGRPVALIAGSLFSIGLFAVLFCISSRMKNMQIRGWRWVFSPSLVSAHLETAKCHPSDAKNLTEPQNNEFLRRPAGGGSPQNDSRN